MPPEEGRGGVLALAASRLLYSANVKHFIRARAHSDLAEIVRRLGRRTGDRAREEARGFIDSAATAALAEAMPHWTKEAAARAKLHRRPGSMRELYDIARAETASSTCYRVLKAMGPRRTSCIHCWNPDDPDHRADQAPRGSYDHGRFYCQCPMAVAARRAVEAAYAERSMRQGRCYHQAGSRPPPSEFEPDARPPRRHRPSRLAFP